MTSVYGKIVVASDIERAVQGVLEKWFSSYLREVERQQDWADEELVSPKNYSNRNSFDVEPGEVMPKVVIVSPGLAEQPGKVEGNGVYRAKWSLGVGVAIAARTEEKAKALADMYGAAVRGILLQVDKSEFQNVDCIGVDWVDENYDDLPVEDQLQKYRASMTLFVIEVDNAVSIWSGPAEPSELPQELGTAQRVEIQIPDYEKSSSWAMSSESIHVEEDQTVVIS
jgi:hypothetical protein